MVAFQLYTDGSCRYQKDGAGGWGAVVLDGQGMSIEASAFVPKTTSCRMELVAVIEGLRLILTLKSKWQVCSITVYSDSLYVIKPLRDSTLFRWIQQGWKTKIGRDVANQDLWHELLLLLADLDTTPVFWEHVKGHSGVKYNEVANTLATKASYKGMTDAQEATSQPNNLP